MCDTTHPINQAYIIAQYKLSSQLQWHETQTPDLSKDHALLNYPLSKSCILSSSKQLNQATRPFQVHEQKLVLRQTAYWVNCKRKTRSPPGMRYFLVMSTLNTLSGNVYRHPSLLSRLWQNNAGICKSRDRNRGIHRVVGNLMGKMTATFNLLCMEEFACGQC